MIKFIFFFMCFIPSLTWAASCCGGGFSIPALILGDDKAQFTASVSNSTVSDEVLGNGKWLNRRDDNQAQTLKLEGATLLSEHWQAGFALPVIAKSANNLNSASGLGDVSIYLGHESFPETSYSRWKPKGLTFLQWTLPTSPSIYDTSNTSSTEIRGRGFHSLGVGMALTKTWKVLDANFNAEIHRSLPRHISNPNLGGEVDLEPGWGTSQTVGLGWNYGDLRVGSSLSHLYEDPIRLHGSTESSSASQKNFTWSLAGSYMMNPESALTLSYADQTLIGNPLNSSLSKTINLSYQQRWPR